MDIIDVSTAFLGGLDKDKGSMRDSTVPSETHTITGTATSDSADGLVMVDLEGYTISDDDQQSLELPTTVDVHEGDTVQVTLVGGVGKSPIVTGVVGGGDRLSGNVQEAVQTAQDAADAVAEVADVKNYFFHDDDGAHVTTEPNDATTGKNVLIDSDGMDVRNANTSVAYFHADGAQVGADTESHIKVEQSAIGMWAQWNPTYGEWRLAKVLNIYYNAPYAHVDAPTSLWLGSATGNVVLAAADGYSNGEVVLRSANMTVRDENGNQLWKGTAQQLADALTHASNQTGYTYGGSTVKTVTASREITVFSNSDVRSLFNVKSGKEGEIAVSIMNGDYGAQAHRVTSVNYRSSSGWNMYLDGNASAGAFRINYIVHVPADRSTL